MKKYLLTVLALSATMMMACNPDHGKGGGENPPVADYTLSTDVIEVYLENYGDSMYGVGLNNYNLTVGAMAEDGNIKMLFVEYFTELSNKTGEGTFGPVGTANLNFETFEGLKANTYIDAIELEGQIMGSGYVEMNMATEEYTVYDGIVSGDLTIKKDGEDYVVKGILTTLQGKILKVDYTGAVEFGDYSDAGGAEPLSANKTVKANKYFSSAVKFLKK